jgi:serine/threonine protein kinase
LGAGGMGVVYLARNKLMDRLEVLKVISTAVVHKEGALDRFLREIRAAAALSHDNVVKAYTALQLGDLLVFAMEYVEGDDLSKVVKTQGPLAIANACYYARQVALGLQHAHDKNMVHRDIKPHNLILARVGKKHMVKILDFGLAKAASEKKMERDLTGQGRMLGTPDYMAPEQILDAASADIRADIYSLGCTLYYLLTGAPPFDANSLFELLQAHQSTTAKPLNLVRPEVPVELAAVVAKMMAKEPSKRYQKPGDIAQALTPFFMKPGTKGPGARPSIAVSEVVKAEPRRPDTVTKRSETVGAKPSDTFVPPEKPAADPFSFAPEPLVQKPSPKKAKAKGKLQQRFKPLHLAGLAVAAGVVFLGLLLWAAGVFRVKTPEGTIVLKDAPETKTDKQAKPKAPVSHVVEVDSTERLALFFDYGSEKGIGNTMNFGLVAIDPNNPPDPNPKRLTYDKRGRTNSTVALIDGIEKVFGKVSASGKWSTTPSKSGDFGGQSVTFQFTPDKLYVTQTVQIMPGEVYETSAGTGFYQRALNTALIKYKVENKDANRHSFGLRVMIDTLIGQNDGVPFTIPGMSGLVSTSKDFRNRSEIPDFIQALEEPDIANPGTVVQMDLKLADKLAPDRVSLTHWPGPNSPNWEVKVQNIDKDSAIVLYWNPKDLYSGEHREMAFSYGLGNLKGGKVGLTVGGTLAVGRDMTVVAYVADPKPGEKATLELPKGFELLSGYLATQEVPSSVRSSEGKVRPSLITWRVRPSREGRQTLTVTTTTNLSISQPVSIARSSRFSDLGELKQSP